MGGKSLVIVGSLNRDVPYYHPVKGEGISVFSFDEEANVLELRDVVKGIDNPTYLCVHPNRDVVFAVSEVVGWNEGIVTAFSIDRNSGKLTYINKQPTLGSNSNFVSTDPAGRYLFVANYGHEPWSPECPSTENPGRSVTVFAINKDGSISPPLSSVRHEGPQGVSSRQDRPHPHCVEPSPDGAFIVVADLGLDRLYFYSVEGGRLDSLPCSYLQMKSGSGPRHVKFRSDGAVGWVVDELSSSTTAVNFRQDGNSVVITQTVSNLVSDFSGKNSSADIHVAPDERFLYVSNRGDNSLTTFAIDQVTGMLELVGHTASGGLIPRNFALTSSGSHVLVANQGSDCLALFSRGADEGELKEIGKVEVGTPMCVKLLRLD